MKAEPTTEDMTEGTDGPMIAAAKVAGTLVYGPDGEEIGRVVDVMIRKRSGQVAYAVIEFGGFLGIGTRQYALPWHVLTYDTRLEGYVVPNLTRHRLEQAPVHDPMDRRSYASADVFWGGGAIPS